MKRWMLLGANNVDTEIDVETFSSYEDAKEAMDCAWEFAKGEDNVMESELEEYSASILTGDNDLYYWQIKEIEV